MKTQYLQSMQHRNASTITAAHANVKQARKDAAIHYRLAQEHIKHAQRLTKIIKKLAANQVAIKKDIKGGKVSRIKVKKPDSRELSGSLLTNSTIMLFSEHNLPVAAQTAP